MTPTAVPDATVRRPDAGPATAGAGRRGVR